VVIDAVVELHAAVKPSITTNTENTATRIDLIHSSSSSPFRYPWGN
jgi:hypothetical protein